MELDRALQNVERVHVVAVGVGVDTFELRQERQVEHRELRQVGLDHECGRFVLDALTLAWSR